MNVLYILIIAHATATVPNVMAVVGPVTQAQCDAGVAGSTEEQPVYCTTMPEVIFQIIGHDCKLDEQTVIPNLALGASTQAIYACR